MSESVQSVPELSKEYILNIRFPYKLWILVNTENQVVVWGPDGTTILVNYVALNLYLTTSSSIFKSKTGYKFLRQLTIHDFEKVSSVENDKESSRGVVFEYKHVSFLQNRHDLIGQIVVNKELTKQLPKPPCDQDLAQQPSHRATDPCLSKIRPLSAIEKARLHLRIHLRMQTESYTLSRKLSDCERKSPSSAVSVIELPADSFENPFDSISQFEENPEYAGYYGNASTEQIKQFFDEYLPIYAQANGDEVAERPGPQNSQKETPQLKQSPPTTAYSYVMPNEQNEDLKSETGANPSNFQIKYSVNLDASNDSKEYTLNILEETCSRVASTNVDPDVPMNSYADYEDDNDPNGRDEDISMDEYLKFKNNEEKPATENLTKGNETSCDIKLEMVEPKGENVTSADEMKESNEVADVEDDSSDNNFKNFFNQYRESINLLYD